MRSTLDVDASELPPKASTRTVLCTVLALVGFAGNSLLARAALADGGARIDPASFTAVRIGSGAAMLALIVVARRGALRGGSWRSALALFAYAAAFSLAYVRIPAGTGALLLFGSVQATMIGAGLAAGERPGASTWVGLAGALLGLGLLAAPGVGAADPLGAALMISAGIAWGVYSLRGRGSARPLASTATSFVLAVPLAALLLLAWTLAVERPRATPEGLALAIASGALASGLGYSLWYAALPALSATRASVVQLTVPVLTALGGVALLGERVTPRLAVATFLLLGGVGLALRTRRARPPASPQSPTRPRARGRRR